MKLLSRRSVLSQAVAASLSLAALAQTRPASPIGLMAFGGRGSPSPGAWKLPDGYFIPAKMAPQIIHPRTDAEMSAYARAARCPSAIAWEIPIVVQGGAWPFLYELVSGPSGMVMTRETLPSDWLSNGAQGYGVLAWSNPTVGTHEITVRVTDQDLTEVERTWNLEVIDRENTTYFLWLDAVSGDDSNSGAYSTPRETLGTGMYGGAGGKSANTWAGRQVFLRTGTYTTLVNTGNSVNGMGVTSNKPAVFVATPGESVTLDCSAAYIDFESMTDKDVCFQGFSWTGAGPRSGDQTKHFMRFAANTADRRLIFDNDFDGGGDTESANGSNSSVVMNRGRSGTEDSYGCEVQCTYHDCDNMDLALYYDTYDHVAEFNRVTGSYGGTYNLGWGWFIKGGDNSIADARFTFRANVAISTDVIAPLVTCTAFTGQIKEDIEVCWNNFKNSQTSVMSNRVGCIRWGQSDGMDLGSYGDLWSYRNNLTDEYIDIIDPADGAFVFQNDVHQNNEDYTDGILQSGGNYPPAVLTLTSIASGAALVDATTNLLTGSARTTYLGTHGCEVYAP